MSALAPVTGSALARRRSSGIVFLAVLAGLVWLSVLLYQKAFTKVVMVTLNADRAGNQLSVQADVKVRGLVVGTVRSIRSSSTGATIRLALDPNKVRHIPENVLAQLVPKTLFGEKYVNLVIPPTPEGTLRAGDVIPQDRSTTALETERVLNDTFPLLQSLRPAQLSLTLNALSGALRGRGDKLGSNLALAGAYLHRLNPSVPTAGSDLQGLADFANNLDAASPGLLAMLDNTAAIGRNLHSERPQLDAFLGATAGFASTAQSVVAANEANLVALAHASTPSLELFARYSPEFPCLLKGLSDYEPIVSRAFGGAQPGLHITLKVTRDNGGYAANQGPKYLDTRGPSCWRLPHPLVPEGDDRFNDGYETSTTPSPNLLSLNPALAVVTAPVLDVPAAQVPDVVGMLLGPVSGGHAVALSKASS